jgi:hypothetical protein
MAFDTHTKPFQAEADAILADQVEKRAQHRTGVSWSAMSRLTLEVEDVEAIRQRIAPLLAAQADLAAEDAGLPVTIRIGDAAGLTDLDALCRGYGLGWAERADIRGAMVRGEVYAADEMGGWSGLPLGATVVGFVAAVAERRAA